MFDLRPKIGLELMTSKHSFVRAPSVGHFGTMFHCMRSVMGGVGGGGGGGGGGSGRGKGGGIFNLPVAFRI